MAMAVEAPKAEPIATALAEAMEALATVTQVARNAQQCNGLASAPPRVAEVSMASAVPGMAEPPGPLEALPPEEEQVLVQPTGDDRGPESVTEEDPVICNLSLGASAQQPPPPAGALFKCSYCDELVYESQLDHHVSLCFPPSLPEAMKKPEECLPAKPDESSPAELGQAETQHQQAEAKATSSSSGGCRRRPRSADAGRPVGQPRPSPTLWQPHNRIQMPPPQDMEDEGPRQLRRSTSAEGTTRRQWRRWEDSEIQVHHAEAEERACIRRQQLLEEKQQREEGECTFTPRLISRRSKSCGRLSGSYTISLDSTQAALAGNDSWGCGRTEDEWHDWLGQQVDSRRKKMEDMEEQMYGNITHHPQITHFAKAWAREREAAEALADSLGRPTQTVFERLYHVAVQTQAKREEVRAQREAELAASGTLGSSKSGATPSRRPGYPEHLYTAALEQRARARSREEMASEQANAERRAACQVLGRSRRYYWQMLERQIKVAFDAATGGGDKLAYPALEEFLRHFGVLKPPKVNAPLAEEKAKEESRKLRVSLWRYLDPAKEGFVDFLTLTVFFHVLMGAVDEEAQCLHNLSAPQQQGEAVAGREDFLAATVSSVAEGTGGGVAGREAHVAVSGNLSQDLDLSSSRGTLPAISEEAGADESVQVAHTEGATATSWQGRSEAVAAAAAAAAAADPEGRRICELLMRFDPKRLRTEFRQMYIDRMHYWSGPSGRGARRELPTRPPELNSQSRALAERVAKKLKDDATAHGSTAESHVDLMSWRQNQIEARRKELRAQKEAQDFLECTFHPSLSSSARQRRASSAEIPGVARRSGPGTIGERLYAKSEAQHKVREARAAAVEQFNRDMEKSSCTFRPDLTKSGQSYTSAKLRPAGTVMTPRGTDESTQRLRRAFAEKDWKRRALANRCEGLSPRSARTSVSTLGDATRRRTEHMQTMLSELSPVAAARSAGPSTPRTLPHSPSQLPSTSVSIPVGPLTNGTPFHDSDVSRADSAPQDVSHAGSCASLAQSCGGGSHQGAPAKAGKHQRPQQRQQHEATQETKLKQRYQSHAKGQANQQAPAVRHKAWQQHSACGNVARAPAPSPWSLKGKAQKGGTDTQGPAAPLDSGNMPKGAEAASAQSSQQRRPLVIAEVQLGPDQPAAKLVLMEGDSAEGVAATFAAEHQLTSDKEAKLVRHLKDLLGRAELKTKA